MKRFYLFRWVFLIFSFIIFSSSLPATVVLKMGVKELAKNSCSIVIGEVEEINKELEEIPQGEGAQVLNTTLDVRVEKILKACSSVKEGEVIRVSRVGGKIGEWDMRVPGAPTFQNKTKVLLFLSEMPQTAEHVISGFSQGKFRIVKDQETGEEVAVQAKEAKGLLLVDETSGKGEKGKEGMRIKLKELEEEIRNTV
ncbi:MAG: hypothetical protein HYS07_03400 [Chlamydiae bacterium]|nr:hypothetical protein [Chlamydiota bacterium]MBI3276842.1 hypothetical protein [Chlamydiota bacterium]